MKLQFNADLDYQWDAINAITDIFSNQSDLGIGNKLDLLDDELLENISNVQLKQGLQQTKEGNWQDQVKSKGGC